MFPFLCVLHLWQYPAYERSFQTPLNSYLKCFILYSDVGQFTSLTLPPAVISLCAIIFADMVIYFIKLVVFDKQIQFLSFYRVLKTTQAVISKRQNTKLLYRRHAVQVVAMTYRHCVLIFVMYI